MTIQSEDFTISPLVTKIVDTLAEQILSGRYKDRQGFPSERELSEEFGVSRTLIRKVVETLEAQNLIVRSPRCRTIVRSPFRESMPRSETKRRSLGLWLWPYPTDPAIAAMVQGICRALDHNAYRLVIGNLVWDSWENVRRSEERFLEQMTEDQDIVGVLLGYLGAEDNLPALRKVRAANIPMVFVDRRSPVGFDADYVGVDNEYAAEQVVEHLIAQGHRRIAHISCGDRASTISERLTGYRRALEKAGIPFDPALVVKSVFQNAEAVHAEILDNLLSLSEPPTAAFAANDVIAEFFMAALRVRGLRIPEDMAVAGFDGNERWKLGEPFLTTIHQPFELMGMRAANLLLRRIESEPAMIYQHTLLDAPLHIHGSTCPAGRDRTSG